MSHSGKIKSPLNAFSDSAKKDKIAMTPTENASSTSSTAQMTNFASENDYIPLRNTPHVNPFNPAPPQPIRSYTTPPSIAAMLEKMNQIQQDVEKKVEEAIHKHGITRSQLRAYLSNPKNFTPEQFAHLKKCEKVIAQKFLASFNLSPDALFISQTSEIESTTTSPSTAKRGKVKSVGTRRNWIPTR